MVGFSHQAVEDLVAAVAREVLPDDRILTVSVGQGEASDGAPILLIDVVVDPGSDRLDPRRTTSLIGRLRPRLREIDEPGFPVISFIAPADATS